MYVDEKGKRHVGHHDKLVGRGYFGNEFTNPDAKTRWYTERPLMLSELMELIAADYGTEPTDKAAVAAVVDSLLAKRDAARKEKNWAVADQMRDLINLVGIRVEDR